MTDKFYRPYIVRSEAPLDAVKGILADALGVDVSLLEFDKKVPVAAGLSDYHFMVEESLWGPDKDNPDHRIDVKEAIRQFEIYEIRGNRFYFDKGMALLRGE